MNQIEEACMRQDSVIGTTLKWLRQYQHSHTSRQKGWKIGLASDMQMRYLSMRNTFIHKNFPFISENNMKIHGCIKIETDTEVNNVNVSIVRSQVKSSLYVRVSMDTFQHIGCMSSHNLGSVPMSTLQTLFFWINFPNSN